MGFGHLWINLVCLPLSTASTRILVNCMPGEEIFHHRGAQQGDPLSPMLFILVMQVFHCLIDITAQQACILTSSRALPRQFDAAIKSDSSSPRICTAQSRTSQSSTLECLSPFGNCVPKICNPSSTNCMTNFLGGVPG
jgi:hypothetical protein